MDITFSNNFLIELTLLIFKIYLIIKCDKFRYQNNKNINMIKTIKYK